MNLEGKISLIKSAVQAIKQAIIGKGQTPSGNLTTYATAIDNIVIPNNQNKTITSNGTVSYDSGYTGLGQVTVNVQPTLQSKTATTNGIVTASTGYYGLSSVNVNLPLSSKTITYNGVYNADSDNLEGYSSVIVNTNTINCIILSQRTPIGSNIVNVAKIPYIKNNNLVDYLSPYAETISANLLKNSDTSFTNNTVTEVLLSNIKSVGAAGLQQAFIGCTALTNLYVPSLEQLNTEDCATAMCWKCTSLQSVIFPKLSEMKYTRVLAGAFMESGIETLSFPSLNSNSFSVYNDQFYRMLYGVTGCTVHFPSNLQSVIGSWSDVTAGFGGTRTTVLFDLPATT